LKSARNRKSKAKKEKNKKKRKGYTEEYASSLEEEDRRELIFT
jgi:hypothetical protein